MTMDIKLEGLDELISYVEDLGRNIDDLKDQALIESGDYLKEQYESGVYSHYLSRRSGESEKSITRTEPSNDELFVGIKGGARRPGFYLYMHEFGYWNVRAKRFIAPKPTFSIIYENNKNKILDIQAEVIRRGLGMS